MSGTTSVAGPLRLLLATGWWASTTRSLGDHGLRLALLFLAVAGITLLVVRRRARRRQPAARRPTVIAGVDLDIWLRYSVIGAVFGVAWLWNTGVAPWLHALRLVVLVLVLAPLATWFRRRRAARSGHADPMQASAHVRGWVVAKVALVVVALAIEVLLGTWVSRSTSAAVVAVLLLLTVAVAGPLVHNWLAGGWRRPAPAGAPPDGPGLPLRGAGGLDKGV
jgi:uncharacterized membrane protein